MRNAVQSLLAEPRAPQPPARVWRDWALVAVLVPTAILEGIFLEDVVWRPVALVLGVALVATLLWRRTNPLVTVAIAFGTLAVVDLVAGLTGTLDGPGESAGLYTMAYVIVLPYSLFRWGAGREAAIGLAIMLATAVLASFREEMIVEAVAGPAFLLLPAALGASVRYRVSSRRSEMDQVKLREREQLARELHDTVAHHVSASPFRPRPGAPLPPPIPTRP